MDRPSPRAALAFRRLDARLDKLAADYPLVLRLLVLFVFFLPLLSVQVPSIVAGFSVNPARLLIFLCLGAVLATKCLFPHSRVLAADPGVPSNRVLAVLVAYLALSVVYYYAMLTYGQSVPFGTAESFFRSWRGRPVAQLLSFLTYGVAPYLLIRRYAALPQRRRTIGGALVAATLLLVAYGCLQQLFFQAGLPVSGRLLYEGAGESARLATYRAGGVMMLRFYSLGGEPRDYGTFIIGATLFYVAWRYRRANIFRATVAALVGSFFLTLSTSAFLAFAIFALIATVDATKQGWVRVGTVGRIALAILFVAGIFVLTDSGSLVLARSLRYVEAIRTVGAHRAEYAALLRAQAGDLGALFYLIDLPDLPLHRILFGYGFGNFTSGMSQIVLRLFDYDIVREGTLEDARAFAIKLLIETGVVGIAAFLALFLRTLRVSRRLIDAAKTPDERVRRVALRYAYMAFFVAGMIQTSFYHFVVMGLIDGEAAGDATDAASSA
jgi:hypothetical protein